MRGGPSFGFVTLAHDSTSLRRARAMALSLRRHEPQAPIALLAACDLDSHPMEFDEVLEVNRPEPFAGSYRFLNKLVALARHAPFARNFFLDDDVLVLGPLMPTIETHFAYRPFALHCDRRPADAAFSGSNHIDPPAIAEAFGVDTVMDPYGGGHLYFERPSCEPLFREAVELVVFDTAYYRELSGDGFVSDETALAVLAHVHRFEMPSLDSWIDPLDRRRAEAIELDMSRNHYRFRSRDRGSDQGVLLLHFCADGKDTPVYQRAVAALLDEQDPPRRGFSRIFGSASGPR